MFVRRKACVASCFTEGTSLCSRRCRKASNTSKLPLVCARGNDENVHSTKTQSQASVMKQDVRERS